MVCDDGAVAHGRRYTFTRRSGLGTLLKSAPGGTDAATPFRRARFIISFN
jgi:hypothetical protein